MMSVANPSTATQTLDNRGSDCAAGFVTLLEMMDTLAVGETLRILSTDPASQRELREWTDRTHTVGGNQLRPLLAS
jgi:TusA-related sulfurtransferase